MPTRDMTTDHIDRYNLERELKEIEARQRASAYERDALENPPPAYEAAPSHSKRSKRPGGNRNAS